MDWKSVLYDFVFYVAASLAVVLGVQLLAYLRARIQEARASLPEWAVRTLELMASIAVRAAEQMKVAYGFDNEDALNYALEVAGQALATRGLQFPEEVVRAAIEAQVHALHTRR